MKSASELIKKERFEQINKHHYSAKHDDEVNDLYQLQIAAEAIIEGDDSQFPAGWDLVAVQNMCDKEREERLIIAGAFYVAEIERLERRLTKIKREINELTGFTNCF